MVLGEFRESVSEHLETFRLMLFELSQSDFWFIIFLLLVITLLWLALRGVRTWYWKQNRILETLEEMQEIMERMLELQLRMSHKPGKESKVLHTLFDAQETEAERDHGKRPKDFPGSSRKVVRQDPSERSETAGAGRSFDESDTVNPEGGTGPSDDATERKYPLPPIK